VKHTAKKSSKSTRSNRLIGFFASDRFFYIILGFSVLSAIWVAISSLYPMAFDEDFHLGMIRLYAEHWLPFSIRQVPEANVFGSVVTDPSYLFHYLMSFPYRILDGLGASETTVVITLRLMNVAMFAVALLLYRKLLLRIRVSRVVTNVVLALFVLIPVVPLLAGQINYDNVLLMLVPGSMLLALNVREGLRSRKVIRMHSLLALLLLLIFGTLVKYAFLPIAAGIFLIILYEIIRVVRHDKHWWQRLLMGLKSLSVRMKWLFGVLFIIAIILFGQKYGTNLVKYHDPVPDCGAVLTVEQCMPYGPWGRDYRYSQTADQREKKNAVAYTVIDWVPGMWRRLYFTIAGPTIGYDTQKPLPIVSIAGIVLVVGGALLLLRYGREIFHEYPVSWLFVIPSVFYIFAVWLQVYKLYQYTAWPVAINGRYVIPLLPLLGVIVALGYVKFARHIGAVKYAGIAVVIVLLLSLQGGGITTYIVRSQDTWFMPNSWMQDANGVLRDALKPALYEGGGWFSYRGGP